MTENFPVACRSEGFLPTKETLNLLQLPEEILLHVLSFISYHNISEIRRCSRTFNRMCQHALNQGFSKVDRFHGAIQRKVKSKLPRRESERRNHSLARHVDILSAIETRLSLLNMTYMKYIDVGLCSFIPGKVLDEMFRILRVLQDIQEPPRAHEFLQELRDISSMAMEHFEEKIVPLVKQKMPNLDISMPFYDSIETAPAPQEFPEFPAQTKKHDVVRFQYQITSQWMSSIRQYRKVIETLRQKVAEQKKRVVELEKKSSDQGRIISEQNVRLQEQDRKIGDISRKILEHDQKLNGILSASSSSKDALETSMKEENDTPESPRENASDQKSLSSRKRRRGQQNIKSTSSRQNQGKRRKN